MTRASAVRPIRTTWGSHALYAGQVSAARPRRGQRAGGDGRPPLPPSTRKRAGLALEPLEERLVSAVVVQAEARPAQRDREPGRRPARVARPRGQAVAEAEPEAEVRRVVHQVVEIDPVEAGRPPPARDLAVDVVEPERQVRQRHAGDETPRACRSSSASRAAPAAASGAASVTWCAERPSRTASQVP